MKISFYKKNKKIISYIIVFIIIIALILVFNSSKQISYDFTSAYDYYNTYNLDSPQIDDIELTNDNVVSNIDVVSSLEAGYEERDVAKLDSYNNEYNRIKYLTPVIEQKGLYYLVLEYKILSDNVSEHTVNLKVNDNQENIDFYNIPLNSTWKYQNNNFELDSYGNDVLPMQESIDDFVKYPVCDNQFKYPTALPLSLNSGQNKIEIELNYGEIYLAKTYIKSFKNNISYSEYIKNFEPSDKVDENSIVIDAEKPLCKNSISILPSFSKDVNVTPYKTYNQPLNVISFNESNEAIVYNFEVKKDGLYNIAFNYNVAEENTTVFRKITIDNEIPFGELNYYPFAYNSRYELETLNRKGEVFDIYLTKGKHTISVEVDGVIINNFITPIKNIQSYFSELYLEMKKLVGINPDRDREWEVEDYFPTIITDFQDKLIQLENHKNNYHKINGANVQTQTLVYIDSTIRNIENMLKEPNEIPNNIAKISKGTDSIVQTLSSAILEMKNSEMFIDKILITGSNAEANYKEKTGLYSFLESVKVFFGSFFMEERTVDEDAVDIWVNRPLPNVNLLQKMADSDFTKQTGINVNISVMKDESKLILSNASGVNPDGVLGISNWLPYELGIRGLIYDLNNFSDGKDYLKQFNSGSLLPLIYNEQILGMPETQNAFVLYYRKDILDSLNLEIPSTWQDVKYMLPQLQRNGMNFYLPLSSQTASKPITTTAPFIYQFDGCLYSNDGMSTVIDSMSSIEGIKLMTDLYTIYGLPQQIANFAESFRDGSIPIGIADLSVYNQLLVSAPEIVGLWDIALSPGNENENNEIERWQSGSATSACILSKSTKQEQVWSFMKWWMSTEVQSNYQEQIAAIWGNEQIWSSANQEAFDRSVFKREHKDIILQQWVWLYDVPRTPGWYMIERELSNAWNKIVIDGVNIRIAIGLAVTSSNKEMARRFEEFGYIENGKAIKPFVITSIEEINEWKSS